MYVVHSVGFRKVLILGRHTLLFMQPSEIVSSRIELESSQDPRPIETKKNEANI